MKRVLVLGGSYFIGRKIVQCLREDGYLVDILNRGSSNENINCNEIIKCDRNDIELMKSKLQGRKYNIIIDVSALNKKQVEILSNSIDYSSVDNHIFISSSAVYDSDNISAPYSENMQLGRNKYWQDYGTNKIEAEEYLMNFYKDKNINLYILRPPYMYGENNYVKRESMIFHHILNNKPIIVPGDGSTKIQFMYTGDLAKVIINLINLNNKGVQDIYNVGNNESVTFIDWINYCFAACNKKTDVIMYNYNKNKYVAKDFFPFHDYDNVLDVSKVHNILKEDMDFLEGLKKCYKWYLENKNDIEMKPNVTKNEQEILNDLYK